jgi:hypothetical protein
VGSAFLNNTPLVAMMIPVVRDLARTTGLPGSKLFMGLSFVSILGGICTLIGTSVNLIIAGLVVDAVAAGRLPGMKQLAIFDPVKVGLPAALAGLAFMIFIGQRMLPGTKREDSGGVVRRMYRCEFRVEANSNLDGKTLEQAGFAQPVGYRLLSITRSGEALDPAPSRRLQGSDLLAFAAPTDILTGLWTTIGLVPAYATPMTTRRHQHRLVELVASSKAFGIGHGLCL